MSEYLPEGKLLHTAENQRVLHSEKLLRDAAGTQTILEARATLCDASHNLCVDLGPIRGVIPSEEGALGMRDGSVRDIAVISRVNRPVCFTVSDIITDDNGEPCALLSRANAQKLCLENYISKLDRGDVVRARVTHLESFGAFADIGCGIAALMPIDAISVSRIEFSAGETVAGIVRSVENYGAFVELTPNLAGLAESREGVRVGQQASVFIKSIIPEKMKIKLIIIDTFEYKYHPAQPVYFTRENHIDRFLYSPAGCKKTIETVFNQSSG